MTRHYFFRLFAVAAATLAAIAAHAAASGYAVSPERTSVEADFSQVFSARFLNASGQPAAGEAVQLLTSAYVESLQDLIVIQDEVDLPLGKLRIRERGSAVRKSLSSRRLAPV